MKLPYEIIYIIIDEIIKQKDIKTLSNFKKVDKNCYNFIKNKRKDYKIQKSFYNYMKKEWNKFTKCPYCGIFIYDYFDRTYKHTWSIDDLTNKNYYTGTVCSLELFKKYPKEDLYYSGMIISKKNKIHGSCIKATHPEVMKQFQKEKYDNLFVLKLIQKYKLHLFFNSF